MPPPSSISAGATPASPCTTSGTCYTLRRLFAFNVHNLIDLSERPFQILSLVCFFGSLLLALRAVASAFWPGSLLGETTNGLILNALAFALLIVVGALSGVGEYVIRSYVVLRGTPAYIIRTVRRRDEG